MILYLSGRDTDDLLMVLEGVAGVVIKRSAERKKRKYFEKGARKDSMGEVSAKIFLGSGVGAKARAAAREIVVEGVRSKQVAVVIKGEGNAEIALAGPSPDEGQLQALADRLM